MESNCKSMDVGSQDELPRRQKKFPDLVPMVDMDATGKRIKELREQAGLTVLDLQELLGLASPQAVYKWQRGAGLPGIENLFALSYLFEVLVEDIIVFTPRS